MFLKLVCMYAIAHYLLAATVVSGAGGDTTKTTAPVPPLPLCDADTRNISRGAPTIDLNNPKYFAQVYERAATETAKRIISVPRDTQVTDTIVTPSGDFPCRRVTRRVQQYVYAEVDLDSKIIIDFDRPWLVEHGANIDAEIGIEGTVGSRQFQIQGYSVIGQKIQTASVRVQSSTGALETIGDILIGRSAFNYFRQYRRKTSDTLKFNAVIARERRQVDSLGKAMAGVAALLASARARVVAPTTDTSVTNATHRLQSDSARTVATQRIVEDQLNLDTLTKAYNDTTLALQARDYALNDSIHILGALGAMRDTSASMFRAALGRLFNRDTSIMVKDSAMAKIQIDSLRNMRNIRIDSLRKPGTQVIYEDLTKTLNELYFVVNEYNPCTIIYPDQPDYNCNLLDSATRAELNRRLSNIFVGSLKDADVLVSQTGANDGDDILITIWNNQNTQTKQRALTIRLRARRFGVVRRITDSFLFINRLGASQASSNAAIAAASKRASSGTDTASANTADPAQFVPTAGVTLGWTYYARTDKFWRFVEPGGGINVSFPQFKSTITSFTPSGTAGTASTVTVQQQGSVDVAVGPVLTLFDNAVQATLGWDLTAPKKQFYWGLGFSFISLIQKAANAASGPKASTAGTPSNTPSTVVTP
jgi:hypothetical protein